MLNDGGLLFRYSCTGRRRRVIGHPCRFLSNHSRRNLLSRQVGDDYHRNRGSNVLSSPALRMTQVSVGVRKAFPRRDLPPGYSQRRECGKNGFWHSSTVRIFDVWDKFYKRRRSTAITFFDLSTFKGKSISSVTDQWCLVRAANVKQVHFIFGSAPLAPRVRRNVFLADR